MNHIDTHNNTHLFNMKI